MYSKPKLDSALIFANILVTPSHFCVAHLSTRQAVKTENHEAFGNLQTLLHISIDRETYSTWQEGKFCWMNGRVAIISEAEWKICVINRSAHPVLPGLILPTDW